MAGDGGPAAVQVGTTDLASTNLLADCQAVDRIQTDIHRLIKLDTFHRFAFKYICDHGWQQHLTLSAGLVQALCSHPSSVLGNVFNSILCNMFTLH